MAAGTDFEPTICNDKVDVGVAGRGSSEGQQFVCRDVDIDRPTEHEVWNAMPVFFEKMARGRSTVQKCIHWCNRVTASGWPASPVGYRRAVAPTSGGSVRAPAPAVGCKRFPVDPSMAIGTVQYRKSFVTRFVPADNEVPRISRNFPTSN